MLNMYHYMELYRNDLANASAPPPSQVLGFITQLIKKFPFMITVVDRFHGGRISQLCKRIVAKRLGATIDNRILHSARENPPLRPVRTTDSPHI